MIGLGWWGEGDGQKISQSNEQNVKSAKPPPLRQHQSPCWKYWELVYLGFRAVIQYTYIQSVTTKQLYIQATYSSLALYTFSSHYSMIFSVHVYYSMENMYCIANANEPVRMIQFQKFAVAPYAIGIFSPWTPPPLRCSP